MGRGGTRETRGERAREALLRDPQTRQGGFVEPTASIPLRFGTYRDRYLAGLALIVSSAVAIQAGNSYALFLIVQGSIVFFAGWAILPASGARRLSIVVPAYLGVALQLAGPQCLPALALPFIAWLVVRQRRRISYLAVLPVLATTLVLANTFREVADMRFTTPVAAIAIVASAWLARSLDNARRSA